MVSCYSDGNCYIGVTLAVQTLLLLFFNYASNTMDTVLFLLFPSQRLIFLFLQEAVFSQAFDYFSDIYTICLVENSRI